MLRTLFAGRRGPDPLDASGVWRYRELVLPDARREEVVTYPEGNTPLLSREAVSRFAGVEALLLKHEGMNPTGSFKDRGMTVGMTQARRIGARAVACASTGNTSASLAAYASSAGLPALVFVPAGQVALGKLAQTLAYGARTLLVRGDFDACFALVREAAEKLNVYLLNSVNPFRIEGQKTIVLRDARAASLRPARLDRASRREPRQHLRLRQGAQGGARARPDREDAAARVHPGRRGRIPSRAASGRASRGRSV